MKTPLEAFMGWFDYTPRSIREYLAHLYQVCTSGDATMMVVDRQEYLELFRSQFVKMDFPLRIAARIFYVRSVFDMVILHHEEIQSGDGLFHIGHAGENVVQISSRQWDGVVGSWKSLRQEELSDIYVHSWTSWMIKLQTETV